MPNEKGMDDTPGRVAGAGLLAAGETAGAAVPIVPPSGGVTPNPERDTPIEGEAEDGAVALTAAGASSFFASGAAVVLVGMPKEKEGDVLVVALPNENALAGASVFFSAGASAGAAGEAPNEKEGAAPVV